jgi:uncharacterized membrane protein
MTFRTNLDLYAAIAAALAASVAFLAIPEGTPLRAIITLPILLLAPGYVTLEAVWPRSSRPNWVHVLLAIGVSPVIIGLLTLSLALVPGAFRPIPIALANLFGVVALAFVAMRRRNPRTTNMAATKTANHL